jgi:hypothetical protein
MRRILLTVVIATLMSSSAYAAGETPSGRPLTDGAASVGADALTPIHLDSVIAVRRPSALVSLYAATVALQAFDAASTHKALDRGAIEANPLMTGVTRHSLAYVSLKGGVAAASIYASERLWREHHKTAAIVFMAASNSMMAFVAANNAKALHELAQR